MRVFWKLMYPFRLNHASSIKKVLSRTDRLLWMKSRYHKNYWWLFLASGDLSSCTAFTRYAWNFKLFWALGVDSRDAHICCNKGRTDFWGDHNIRRWISLTNSKVTTLGVPIRRLSATDPVSRNWRTSWYSVFLHGARILRQLRRHHASLKKSYT